MTASGEPLDSCTLLADLRALIVAPSHPGSRVSMRAYEEGGYEIGPGVWSRVAPGSAEHLEELGRCLVTADL